jgi:RecA-family ATPase
MACVLDATSTTSDVVQRLQMSHRCHIMYVEHLLTSQQFSLKASEDRTSHRYNFCGCQRSVHGQQQHDVFIQPFPASSSRLLLTPQVR